MVAHPGVPDRDQADVAIFSKFPMIRTVSIIETSRFLNCQDRSAGQVLRYLAIVLLSMSAVGLMACSGSPSFELTASGSGDQIQLTVAFTPSETDVDESRWDSGDSETLMSSA